MCMGPPPYIDLAESPVWVYPHVYGATKVYVSLSCSIRGLSPCVWGHRRYDLIQLQHLGSIPMCMGPPMRYDAVCPGSGVYPHVYGATILHIIICRGGWGLSPCVWGHLSADNG